MSDKTPRPDRADDHDLDVPTYNGPSDHGPAGRETRGEAATNEAASQHNPSLYERAGRAAPQEIQPNASSHPAPSDATTAFPAAGDKKQNAPTDSTNYAPAAAAPQGGSAYRDEDFAPTGQAPAQAPAPAPAGGVAYEPTPGHDYTATEVDEPVDGRRGTIDFGLLLARLLLGGWLILESVGTFFQLGGSQGLSGLESEYSNYALGSILSITVPTMQLAAGVFLVVGLVTPVAAAVATVATGFVAIHEIATSDTGLNPFAWPEAVWLSLVLFGLSVVLQFTGPGFYAIDGGRGWARRPLASSWIFVIIGIAALVALWWFGAGVSPLN